MALDVNKEWYYGPHEKVDDYFEQLNKEEGVTYKKIPAYILF